MKKVALVILTLLAFTATASAQLPPGEWWRRPEVVQRLALSNDQQIRLDAVFRAAANDLIDLRAETQKLMVALRGELHQPQLSKQNLQRLAARLNDTRGKLFERELMMLVDMRAVLTDEQWTELRDQLDRRQDRQQQDMPQQQQRGGIRQQRRP
jgi:hypothetical protein